MESVNTNLNVSLKSQRGPQKSLTKFKITPVKANKQKIDIALQKLWEDFKRQSFGKNKLYRPLFDERRANMEKSMDLGG